MALIYDGGLWHNAQVFLKNLTWCPWRLLLGHTYPVPALAGLGMPPRHNWSCRSKLEVPSTSKLGEAGKHSEALLWTNGSQGSVLPSCTLWKQPPGGLYVRLLGPDLDIVLWPITEHVVGCCSTSWWSNSFTQYIGIFIYYSYWVGDKPTPSAAVWCSALTSPRGT